MTTLLVLLLWLLIAPAFALVLGAVCRCGAVEDGARGYADDGAHVLQQR